MTLQVLPGLSANTYQRHVLHGPGAVWLEKNCYADLWIELVHSLGMDPHAMLGFTVALDFLGDQWTFFKPVHDELLDLYGLRVEELTVWRPLLEHAREHLAAGRWISTEADAYWLPDTAGTDYRVKHSKTTIVLNSLDEAGKRLGYFHNAGYHELHGEDFDRCFRIGQPDDSAYLPLFAEVVMASRGHLQAPRVHARHLLRKHVGRLPLHNPMDAFGLRVTQVLPELREAGLAHYHAWAFACTRQIGAAAELAAAHLAWLDPDDAQLRLAGTAWLEIASGCKAFILKGARLVLNGKALEPQPLHRLGRAWEEATGALRVWAAQP